MKAGPTELPREGTQQGRFEIGLLQAWHKCASPRPEVKEIKECLAFHRRTRRLLGDNELLVDAAGGHGGIALAFLASGRIKRAIVADIYQPRGYSNLRAAWAPDAKIEHRHVDLRTAGWLRTLMEEAGVEAAQTVVTACHACGVLADELIHECLQAEVSFAVVPCCHGEKGARGEMLRKLAKDYHMDRGLAYDMLRLGAIDAAPGYIARLRQIDAAITPKNRILLGLHKPEEAQKRREQRRANLDRLAQTAESLRSRSQRSILIGRSASQALWDENRIGLAQRNDLARAELLRLHQSFQ